MDGHKFDSKKEMQRYANLKLMARAKLIDSLELQPRIPIIIKGVAVKIRSKGYPNGRQLTYVADFRYFDKELREWVIEDVKGHRTEVYKIKRALVEAMGLTIIET